ncbi:type II toxin-antitoxin system RelE/ParE family toxin [Patescibacteria group bacterium]|nr:type II toxin-antitoxin system RelE/ParE family toxin [Patescibacteria group bacterium]MBU1721751.1 type II toxin-antitoxin system RelE/ParE family toxin [Patescibacteria group bacterium]MBU1901410.1 type II toxin-antitoxin system RelE/ParE family toxin [Patescibacteria group bacterium]
MIKSFYCKETEKIYHGKKSRKLAMHIQRNTMRKLWMIHASIDIVDLRVPPANHLERLVGDMKGFFSIRINKQWRICFRWKQGHAYDVHIIDYH